MNYVKQFETIGLQDGSFVGGKNASLGQMTQQLSGAGIRVPQGFAVTVQAYWDHLSSNGIQEKIVALLSEIDDTYLVETVKKVGQTIRTLIEQAPLAPTLEQEIVLAYEALVRKTGKKTVAVRSSATAEDLPDASFAGQQESFLNVSGKKNVIAAYRSCIASLFTDRAILYRKEKGFDHMQVGISVGIQQMVASETACSGVMFTLDTETGFSNVVVISSSYGIGESVVKGEVVPDEFHVFKETLSKGFDPIIKRVCGSKKIKRVCDKKQPGTIIKSVSKIDSARFSLSDDQICELAKVGCSIEQHYSKNAGQQLFLDIEWAYDGNDGLLYIVQARPETVHRQKTEALELVSYRLKPNQKLSVLTKGQSVGQKIVAGRARIMNSMDAVSTIQEGDILITYMTDPDWVSVMKKSGGIITESGGRTCHAAIVSRELGIPALVGAAGALSKIQDGQFITLDCSGGSEGIVYEGCLEFEKEVIVLDSIPEAPVKVLLNIASPERAYSYSFLPVQGVGLARLEFIISNEVQVHPMALVAPETITDQRVVKKVLSVTAAYPSTQDFFVKKVAEGVATIAAAFFPRSVLVRFSDFKSNEYRGLLGGSQFEPVEENPMMGLRGASRYYHDLYKAAFTLECEAIRYVRESMGLHNVNVMIPFVRTISEAEKIVELLKANGLVSGRSGLEIYMMCEIPSNVILIDEFAKFFDGFSIGSNDLTQTTLSVDRDSGLLASLFDERDAAVTKMLSLAVHGAHYAGKPIGICGQAPSDYPEVAQFLIEEGINSISLNPDSVIPFLRRFGIVKKAQSTQDDAPSIDRTTIIPARAA